MADPHETAGEDMDEESAQKLRSEQCHLPLFAAVSVVLPSKGDVFPVRCKESMIGYGDPVCVSTQVTENLSRPAECRLSVDDPVLPV